MANDLLILNGAVWTGDPANPRADAVAIADGKIVLASSAEAVRGAVGCSTEVIDAGGRTVLPGLIDAHNHYLATAEALASVNVRFPAVTSRADLTRVIGDVAEVTPPGRWIRAVGLDWAKFPDGQPPTRHDLDEATLTHPIIVYHVSVHHALVNTLAMRERGITDAVQDPPGGKFVRDEAGRLTGLCLDAATDLILPVVVDIGCHGPNFHTQLPGEDSVALLAEASQTYLAAGLTTVCDPQVTRRELRLYREAAARGVLGLRVALMPLSNHLADYEAAGIAGPFGDDRLRIVAMKLYADGTLIGGTAWFNEPYGPHGEFTGSTYWQPEQLSDLVVRAHGNGWQVGIHTQGDRAIGMTLDAIEAAMRAAPRVDTRHRIEHCGYPRPDQIDRMATLGVIPINQPNFLVDSGDDFLRHLGQRAHGLQPLRAELDAGIRPVLSSDAFVSSLRPLDTISAAMTRRTRDGAPIGAEHRLTLDEALRAHTIDAATAIRMDDRIGSLQPGKLADVTIIDGNLEATDPDHIGTLKTWKTILDGRIAWSAGPAAFFSTPRLLDSNRRRLMSVPAKSALSHRLADVPLFAGLSGPALDELARESRTRRYAAGKVLWNEGDPGDALLVLEDGQLRVSRFTGDGIEVVLSVVEAPSALGELALLDGAPRDASVTAQRPVTVRLIPRSSFLALLRREPAVMEGLLSTLAGMVRAGNARHVTTVGLDVPGRLAAWLLLRAREQQRDKPGRPEVTIGRSQGELAAELGTTRSTLNRALNGFEALGLLSRQGDRIVIRDVDALAAYTEEAGDFT